GELDGVVTTNDGAAYLLRNDGGNANRWISVKLVGSRSNRDGIGAVVRIESASGRQWNMVRSGSSYCSQSDLALTFGVARDVGISRLTVEWPSGSRQEFRDLDVNQALTIDETRGIVKRPIGATAGRHRAAAQVATRGGR